MNDRGKYWDEAWNTVIGCTKCSPGCLNCWAEKMAKRLSARETERIYKATRQIYRRKYSSHIVNSCGWTGNVVCDESVLDKPLHWRKPRTVFVNNMGDTFHPAVSFEFVHKIFNNISKVSQRHKHLILTKRPERMAEYIKWETESTTRNFVNIIWPLPNVHLGGTICNQVEADEKIPILLQIPAAKRWLSIEPMLGPVDLEFLTEHTGSNAEMNRPLVMWNLKDGIDWVVIGCESGPNRRPCKIEWIESIVEQCQAAGVRAYVKQVNINGRVSHDMSEWPEKLRVRDEI